MGYFSQKLTIQRKTLLVLDKALVKEVGRIPITSDFSSDHRNKTSRLVRLQLNDPLRVVLNQHCVVVPVFKWI